MNSREKILQQVGQAQPPLVPLPDTPAAQTGKGSIEEFEKMLQAVGGRMLLADRNEDLGKKIASLFPQAKRKLSTILSLPDSLGEGGIPDPHSLEDLDLAILSTSLAVAENGAVWITQQETAGLRVLPFIAIHLVVVLDANDIVPTMLEAYEQIGSDNYPFGVFIAGPSKTADIEQSLVLGAHGPKSMTVILQSSS